MYYFQAKLQSWSQDPHFTEEETENLHLLHSQEGGEEQGLKRTSVCFQSSEPSINYKLNKLLLQMRNWLW